jgi:hypothetical protein
LSVEGRGSAGKKKNKKKKKKKRKKESGKGNEEAGYVTDVGVGWGGRWSERGGKEK